MRLKMLLIYFRKIKITIFYFILKGYLMQANISNELKRVERDLERRTFDLDKTTVIKCT
jgi:hypothetical protein